MKFGYTIVYVRDVEASIAFYEEAFGLKRRFVHESGTYGELETGETALAFVTNEQAASNLPRGFRKNEPKKKPAGIEIAFVTPDVAAAFDHAIKSGARKVKKPVEKPWGQTVAYVRDPDGVLV